jgi:putative acetyltransferase
MRFNDVPTIPDFLRDFRVLVLTPADAANHNFGVTAFAVDCLCGAGKAVVLGERSDSEELPEIVWPAYVYCDACGHDTENLPMLEIIHPTETHQLEMVRELFLGFREWAKTRYDLATVALYFGEAYDAEIRALPGEFKRPDGGLLLATRDGRAAGCVGCRKVDDDTCEVKRMFVATAFQRQGIGRKLMLRLIQDARDAGYKRMRLDTGIKQYESLALYRDLGFVETPPTFALPKEFEGSVIFMALPL